MIIAEETQQESFQHGYLKGRQDGEKFGREEVLYEIARKMLNSGIDRCTTMIITGLSAETLLLLRGCGN
ncbi:hypothetical protein [Photobacterium indicum]|uniref:hypothetical protein n=1 Tax=Photobacterium indicum TaxID=81447 RepID=UPI003D0F2057